MRSPSRTGPKKATNLSVSVRLLKQARKRGISLSATLEEALVEKLRAEDAAAWATENEAALEQYADHVNRVGVFGDHLRRF